MLRLIFVLAVFSLLSSCSSKTSELKGTWYLPGFLQTESKFYNASEWGKIKPKNNSDSTDIKGVYLRLVLNENQTATEQYLDIRTNKPIDNVLSGTWQRVNDTLKLKYIAANGKATLERKFLVQSSDENSLSLKITDEIAKENGKIIQEFSLKKQTASFQKLIKSIGISDEDFYGEHSEYHQDFWEFNNFGKYQILSRYIKVEDKIDNYSPEIKDVIHGFYWDYVPYYQPIFSHSHERLIFNKNDELLIRYEVLSSQSEGCGTLAQQDLSVKWKWNKAANTIKIILPENASFPVEIRNLFKNEKPKTETYKILAKNKYVMIWEKL